MTDPMQEISVPVTLTLSEWSLVGGALITTADLIETGEKPEELRRVDKSVYDQIAAKLGHPVQTDGDGR